MLRNRKPKEPQGRRPLSARSSTVFSYSQRNLPQSNLSLELGAARRDSPVKPKQNINRFKPGLLPSYIALFVIIVTALYAIGLQTSPRLHIADQANTVHRSQKFYEAGIEKLWQQSILSQNKLTFNSKRMRSEILKSFPEIVDVKIDLPLLGRKPAVTLIPVTPVLELVSGSDMYYVNSSGQAVISTKDATKNQLDDLPVIIDETGLDTAPGKSILSVQDVAFLKNLHSYLLKARTSVLTITLPNNAANQADLRLTDETYYVKFSTTSDVRQAVGSYLAVRNRLSSEGVTPKQYIDVRVDEKAFYQ